MSECKRCGSNPILWCYQERGYYCRNCIFKRETQTLSNIILNVIGCYLDYDIDLIYIISSLAVGCCITCCDSLCQKNIQFATQWEFHHKTQLYDKIYWYRVGFRTPNNVSIYGTFLRIFCVDCSRDKLKQCKMEYKTKYYTYWCDNKDTEFECCDVHPFCMNCNKQHAQSIVKSYCSTRNCQNYMCDSCNHLKKCESCLKLKEIRRIKTKLSYIGKCKVPNEIYAMIINYSIGVVVYCCNWKHCRNIIALENEYDWKFSRKDYMGGNLYFYKGYNKRDTVNVYGEQLRIFCSSCNKQKQPYRKSKKDIEGKLQRCKRCYWHWDVGNKCSIKGDSDNNTTNDECSDGWINNKLPAHMYWATDRKIKYGCTFYKMSKDRNHGRSNRGIDYNSNQQLRKITKEYNALRQPQDKMQFISEYQI
eukprot:428308_1